MACNTYTIEHGHPCSGSQDLGCKVIYICSIEDGQCEGSTRCSECIKDDLIARESRESFDHDQFMIDQGVIPNDMF